MLALEACCPIVVYDACSPEAVEGNSVVVEQVQAVQPGVTKYRRMEVMGKVRGWVEVPYRPCRMRMTAREADRVDSLRRPRSVRVECPHLH